MAKETTQTEPIRITAIRSYLDKRPVHRLPEAIDLPTGPGVYDTGLSPAPQDLQQPGSIELGNGRRVIAIVSGQLDDRGRLTVLAGPRIL